MGFRKFVNVCVVGEETDTFSTVFYTQRYCLTCLTFTKQHWKWYFLGYGGQGGSGGPGNLGGPGGVNGDTNYRPPFMRPPDNLGGVNGVEGMQNLWAIS